MTDLPPGEKGLTVLTSTHPPRDIMPRLETTSLTVASSQVELNRFLGEYIRNGSTTYDYDTRLFRGNSQQPFDIELSGSTVGTQVRIKKPESQFDSTIRACSVDAFVTLAKEGIAGEKNISDSSDALQQSLKIVGNHEVTIGGTHADPIVFFDHEDPSIFVTGPDVPPGTLKKGYEYHVGIVSSTTDEGAETFYAVRVILRKVDNNAKIGTNGRVNGDNTNAREILYVGTQVIEPAQIETLYESVVANAEAVAELNSQFLQNIDTDTAITEGVTFATKVLSHESARHKHRLDYLNKVEAGEEHLETNYSKDEGDKSPVRAIPGLSQLTTTGYTGEEREAERDLLSRITGAMGVTGGSYGIKDVLSKAHMRGTPIPQLAKNDDLADWKATIHHAQEGHLVTKTAQGYLRILDSKHPGLFYEVAVKELTGGVDHWNFTVGVIDQKFVKDTLLEIEVTKNTKRFEAVKVTSVLELSDSLTLSGHESIKKIDDEWRVVRPADLLVNGRDARSGKITFPAVVASGMENGILIELQGKTVVLKTDAKSQKAFLAAYEKIDATSAKKLEAELTALSPLIEITQERAAERVKAQGILETTQTEANQQAETLQTKLDSAQTLNAELDSKVTEAERQLREARLNLAHERGRSYILGITEARLDSFVDPKDGTQRSPQTRLQEASITKSKPGTQIVGRDASIGIHIDSNSVSRHHAQITRTADNKKLTLHDLGSTNGTYVNDEKVTQRDLQENDRVRFGHDNNTYIVIQGELVPQNIADDIAADVSLIKDPRLIHLRNNHLRNLHAARQARQNTMRQIQNTLADVNVFNFGSKIKEVLSLLG